MPFDTTYKIFSNFKNEATVVFISGKKDTTIYCTSKDLPAHLKNNAAVKALIKYEESFTHSDTKVFTYIIGLSLMGFLIAYLSKKIKELYNVHFKERINKVVYQIKFARYFILFCFAITAILFALNYYEVGFFALFFTFFAMLEFRNELFYVKKTIKFLLNTRPAKSTNLAVKNKQVLYYAGASLNFSTAAYTAVLEKRFKYFCNLSTHQKEEFLVRIKKFTTDKHFYFHSKEGFKEMPILISAAAIQLTFGLQQYLLPHFKNIHIYPEEFFRADNNGICFLEGNVTGNNINLSWKHFLRGYELETDGQNVGLHEIAHALYYQTFEVEQQADKNFKVFYNDFINHGNKVHETEKLNKTNLYTAYADKSFQEFWAESVEIFFEKPEQLKETYPALYGAMATLLNQAPCTT